VASWGSVVVQYPGVVFLGGTQTQDVTFVGYTTAPHGVYFEVPIPQAVYSSALVGEYGEGYSGTIEQVFAVAGVVGAEWTQTPTASSELTSNLVIYVQSASGNSQASFTVPFANLTPTVVEAKSKPLIAQLDAAEAL
jgi:hypothetical protein